MKRRFTRSRKRAPLAMAENVAVARSATVRSAVGGHVATSPPSTTHELLRLQRLLGNAAVVSLVRERGQARAQGSTLVQRQGEGDASGFICQPHRDARAGLSG